MIFFVIVIVAFFSSLITWAVMEEEARNLSNTKEKQISPFTSAEVKPIPKTNGWSAISVKINNRSYRWDVETEIAEELKKRLQ